MVFYPTAQCMKRIKILQITPYFPPHLWWVEMVSQNISKYLVKYHNVEVINMTSDIDQEKRWYHKHHKDGYEILTIPSFDIVHHFPCFKFWTASFWKALKEIKKEKPDIIQTHTRFFLQTFFGGILAKIWWIKWVHVEHGSWYVTGIPLFKKLVAWIYDQTLGRLVFALCNRIISINQANIPFISRFAKKSKISVIYNGIDAPADIQKIPGNGVVRMTFVGRLSPLKGVDILIEACKSLKEQWMHDWKLSIVWDGEMKSDLQALIDKYHLSDYIALIGPRSHDEIMQHILPATDILINPSHQEWLPTTVLEGLLSRCVVVATDVGGTKEISDHKDLVLVKPGEVKDLQKGLEYALQNHKKISGLSYVSVKEKFDWIRSVEKYYGVYTCFM